MSQRFRAVQPGFPGTRTRGDHRLRLCRARTRLWDLAYLAYRVVPLTVDRADPFDDRARLDRLTLLLTAYGCAATPGEVLATVGARLEALAEFSAAKSVELDKPELADHAVAYRRDRGYCIRMQTR